MISAAEASAKFTDSIGRMIKDCAAFDAESWTDRRGRLWSPAEVAEHVALANGSVTGVFDLIGERPRGDKPLAFVDDEFPFLFYGGGDEPPGVADPTGTWSPSVATARLEESLSAIRDRVNAIDVDLRSVALRHPLFGRFDGVQWLLFLFAHTERHRSDLRRLLAS